MPYGNDYNFDGLLEGMLSGAKFRALQEDAEFSRLQRAEFEASAGHRATLRALQEQQADLDIRRGQTGLALEELTLRHREALAPLERQQVRANIKETKTRTRGLKSDARRARADANVAEQTVGTRVRQSKAQTRISEGAATGQELNNAKSVGELLQYGSTTLTPGDFMNLAKNFGSPDEKSQGVLATILQSHVEGLRAETQENKAVIKKLQEDEALSRLASLVGQLQTVGPEGLEALRGTVPDTVLDAASGTSMRISPEQRSALTGIDKALAETFDQIGTVRGQMAPLEAKKASGKKLSTKWWGQGEQGDFEDLETQLKELEGKLDFLSTERKRVLKSKPSADTGLDELFGSAEFPAEMTKEQIAETIAYAKANGVNLTEARLREYIKSRRK